MDSTLVVDVSLAQALPSMILFDTWNTSVVKFAVSLDLFEAVGAEVPLEVNGCGAFLAGCIVAL